MDHNTEEIGDRRKGVSDVQLMGQSGDHRISRTVIVSLLVDGMKETRVSIPVLMLTSLRLLASFLF